MRRILNFLGGVWQDSPESRALYSPWDQVQIAEVAQATPDQLETAVQGMQPAFESLRRLSRHQRSALLSRMSQGISDRRAVFVEAMRAEAGKPDRLASVEVDRAITTFTCAAEECRRFGGELLPIDGYSSGEGYAPVVSEWFPRGPILAINPFNFPLNLVAHKVAPALAVGCPILVKAPPQAPGCAVELARIFEEAARGTEVPLAALQVIQTPNERAEALVRDPRIPTLSFTGSQRAGWRLQGLAIGKKVLLELGGNAAVIVHQDASLELAAERCVAGGYGYAGQSCISVQRIYVHRSVKDRLIALFLARLSQVEPSPVIDGASADRIMAWVGEAVAAGARILAGGERKGCLISPLLLTEVPPSLKLVQEEVFGPVVVIEAYDDWNEAIARVNDSRFGLQAGLFTDSQKLIQDAYRRLAVGGLVVNDASTYRADPMPYGGVKESGLGREGLRFAMEEYSERKSLVVRV